MSIDGVSVGDVRIVSAHKELSFTSPPGETQSLVRVDVGGQAVECFAPRAEVAQDDATALLARIAASTASPSGGASPLSQLFSEKLPAEQRRGGGARGPASPLAKDSTPSKDLPVVRGPLGGAGPTLSITAQSKWQEDQDTCSGAGCGKEFGLTRRRHHCRVCGLCVCR